MDAQSFCYWLQGYVEIAASRTAPTSDEWEVIKQHLQLVFHKVTPPLDGGPLPIYSPPPWNPSPSIPPWNPPWVSICGGESGLGVSTCSAGCANNSFMLESGSGLKPNAIVEYKPVKTHDRKYCLRHNIQGPCTQPDCDCPTIVIHEG